MGEIRKTDEAKSQARNVLRTYAQSKDCPESVSNAVETLIGLNGRGRQEGSGLFFTVRQMLLDNDHVSELDIFQQFHIGRDSMKALITQWIRKPDNSDDRVWVTFDQKEGAYSVVRQGGDNPPQGWKGPSLTPRRNGNGS